MHFVFARPVPPAKGTPEESYWIGLKKRPLKLDLTVSDYSNWDEQNHLYDCGALQTGGNWISADCTGAKGYICERPRGKKFRWKDTTLNT